MAYHCAVCNQEAVTEQNTFCLHCLIPTPVYLDGKYISKEPAMCGHCGKTTVDRQIDTCQDCQHPINKKHPLKALPEVESQSNKDKQEKDKLLVNELMDDTEQARETAETLGIDHLKPAEQAVALTSLAKEKMHPMSGDFNIQQAKTLVSLGYGLAKNVGENWSVQLATTAYAQYLIRTGKPLKAASLLVKIYDVASESSKIEKLRKLEILATITLAYRTAGTSQIADEYLIQVMKEVNDKFSDMEIEIKDYLKQNEPVSEYLGLDRRDTKIPRLDYYVTILAILVEESIVRGNVGDMAFSDDTMDRMLELDNIVRLLGEISPPDDPAFFAAQLRDYMRLFNGIFWYGDITLRNSGVKRRLLIEQGFQRVLQWINIIPTHFWISLKAGRIIEIFMRSESWSEIIDSKQILDQMVEKTTFHHQPSFYYMFAESAANAQKLALANEYLTEVLSESYTEHIDPALRSLAQQLMQSVDLESIGILMGVTRDSSWGENKINISLERVEVPRELGGYLEAKNKNPTLRFVFDTQNELMNIGISIFGDNLVTQINQIGLNINETIVSVDNRKHDDPSWDTPITSENTKVEGYRMDILIIRTIFEEEPISFLFEGKKQLVTKEDGTLHINPSELLLLRGIVQYKPTTVNMVMRYFVDLLSAKDVDTVKSTEIFVLKKDHTV